MKTRLKAAVTVAVVLAGSVAVSAPADAARESRAHHPRSSHARWIEWERVAFAPRQQARWIEWERRAPRSQLARWIEWE